ncbi:MAG TPA: hypothetical protein VL460_01810 [Caulobacteraceae bacterium]|jgi:hypothetical protein|nr:hypothetical protein [Caulobacteraceae bacterium]
MANLTLVSEAPDSTGRRAIDLMRQARAAGDQHVTAYLQTLELACRQAEEIVAGGEAYPAGVRDLAEKLAEHTAYKAQAIYRIMHAPTTSQPGEKLTLLGPFGPAITRSAAEDGYLADFPAE